MPEHAACPFLIRVEMSGEVSLDTGRRLLPCDPTPSLIRPTAMQRQMME